MYNSFSSPQNLTAGVPQGSILGPVLYNIYTSSIKDVFNKFGFKNLGYADDNICTSMFTHYFQNEVLLDKIPILLSALQSWAKVHDLKLNPDKTKVIIFGSPRFQKKLDLIGFFTRDNVCLKFSDSIKHLGVYLDKSLNLQIHINKLVSSCYSILRHISSIRKFITEEQCHQLIISFLVSKLDYCNALYLGMSKELMYKLQKVQNAAIRIIVNKRKHQSVSEDMVKLHWLNIEKRNVFQSLVTSL